MYHLRTVKIWHKNWIHYPWQCQWNWMPNCSFLDMNEWNHKQLASTIVGLNLQDASCVSFWLIAYLIGKGIRWDLKIVGWVACYLLASLLLNYWWPQKYSFIHIKFWVWTVKLFHLRWSAIIYCNLEWLVFLLCIATIYLKAKT